MSERKGGERRRHPRIKKRHRVQFGPGDLGHHGYTQDISEGGIYLQANMTYPPGTILVMQIEFPEKVVSQRGVVRWSKELPPAFRKKFHGGMGVEFLVQGALPKPSSPAVAAAPAKPAHSQPPPEVSEEDLGRGAMRRRQVSTLAGNTYEVLLTEYRGAHYLRLFQLPRTEGSAEAVFREGFWKKEDADAALKAFLKDH